MNELWYKNNYDTVFWLALVHILQDTIASLLLKALRYLLFMLAMIAFRFREIRFRAFCVEKKSIFKIGQNKRIKVKKYFNLSDLHCICFCNIAQQYGNRKHHSCWVPWISQMCPHMLQRFSTVGDPIILIVLDYFNQSFLDHTSTEALWPASLRTNYSWRFTQVNSLNPGGPKLDAFGRIVLNVSLIMISMKAIFQRHMFINPFPTYKLFVLI